ncbi:MAG: DNA gyrase subunit A [Anaerolineae bacterium]|nr:DNA gyrase subunit A [Anaerolineae bacterium]
MQIGNVRPIDIDDEMRVSYLDYAMSVIVARALPDVRDGFKPVQRRILYAMHDLGLAPDRPYRKSARIVGEVLGKYHPHGESAVYEAMVRMAQDFSMRYPLVDGQGNFGSVDGDSPAAQRYTEARLTTIAREMLADIDKDTVDFVDNFDASLKEPSVLPAVLPNLLVNGATGIAVGMATNIPPHNLSEVCDALVYLIDNYDRMDEVSVADLMRFIRGPDFPTGALIMGQDGIAAAYGTGKGRIIVRAVTDIQEIRGGRYAIVITEIPYQLNKAALLEKIADLHRNNRIDAISDLRDESDREGLRVVIELKRGAQPTKVLNQLFKWTPLQTSFSINMLALVEGQPRVLPLKRALQLYLRHRQEITQRRSRFELDRALRRAHILEGLLKALDAIDAIIETIRSSPDADAALERLMERFGLTEEQSRAILDMQLRRLASLERQRLEEEHNQLRATIEELRELLADPRKLLAHIRQEVLRLKQQYGDERRTRILNESAEPLAAEDLIADEPVLVTITRRGYIKRLPTRTYRVQGRGGKGITGAQTSEEDDVEHFFTSSMLSSVYFFTNRGQVFARMAYAIPDASRTSRGAALVNLLPLEEGERVTAALSVPRQHENGFLCMVTRQGRLKRVVLDEFRSIRPSGIRALSLEPNDELVSVGLTDGSDELLVVTALGRALRFREDEVRPQSRVARGVLTANLDHEDHIAGMEVVEPGAKALILTENGFGKRVPVEDFPLRSRRGKGVLATNQRAFNRTGPVMGVRMVADDDEISIMTTEGMAMRVRAADIPIVSRYAAGNIVMRLNDGDTLASAARIQPPPEQG